MAKEVDECTSCPVCFEDYQKSGDCVPRLLPCSHTLCNKCVCQLTHRNRIICPQDRQTFEAHGKRRKFPQNNYILKQIRDAKERNYKTCEYHGREINLFCRNDACQQEVCSLCLTQSHIKHEVVDLLSTKEAKLAEIVKEIEREEGIARNYGNKVNKIREEANEEISKALADVSTKKEELLTLLNERLTQIDHLIFTMTDVKETLSMENTYAEMSSSQTKIRKETSELAETFKLPIPGFRCQTTTENIFMDSTSETHHSHQCKTLKEGMCKFNICSNGKGKVCTEVQINLIK